MKPYSMDLRERVARALDEHRGSLRQIAKQFYVSISFITRLFQRRRQTGSLNPKPHSGGHPPALQHKDLPTLTALIGKHPDATLQELRDRLGLAGRPMALWRALKRRNITRKKNTLRASENPLERRFGDG